MNVHAHQPRAKPFEWLIRDGDDASWSSNARPIRKHLLLAARQGLPPSDALRSPRRGKERDHPIPTVQGALALERHRAVANRFSRTVSVRNTWRPSGASETRGYRSRMGGAPATGLPLNT